MKTNLDNVPVGGTIAVTNSDGSITYTTVSSRTTQTLAIDLRLWIPIVVGFIILVIFVFGSSRRRE
jgi:hypothetical protein